METLDIIREIIAEKVANKEKPDYATEAEVRAISAEAAQDLDALERCGMIRMGQTRNSRWIVINDTTPKSPEGDLKSARNRTNSK